MGMAMVPSIATSSTACFTSPLSCPVPGPLSRLLRLHLLPWPVDAKQKLAEVFSNCDQLPASRTPQMNISRTVLLREAGFWKLGSMAVQNPGVASAQLHRIWKAEVRQNYSQSATAKSSHEPVRSQETDRSSLPPSNRYWAASNRPKLAPNRLATSQLGRSASRSYTRKPNARGIASWSEKLL